MTTLRDELDRLLSATPLDKQPELVLDLMILAFKEGRDPERRLSRSLRGTSVDFASYSFMLQGEAPSPLSHEALDELHELAQEQELGGLTELNLQKWDDEDKMNILGKRLLGPDRYEENESLIRHKPYDKYSF